MKLSKYDSKPVWDGAIRLFHWSLVIALVTTYSGSYYWGSSL